jgi:hypothetical protein
VIVARTKKERTKFGFFLLKMYLLEKVYNYLFLANKKKFHEKK